MSTWLAWLILLTILAAFFAGVVAVVVLRPHRLAFWTALVALLAAIGSFSWAMYEAATMEIPGSF